MKHTDVNQSQLDEEESVVHCIAVFADNFHIALKESQGCRKSKIKVESAQNVILHLKELLFGIGVISDVNEILDFGGINLLILARNQQSSYSYQLESGLIYLYSFEKSVDNVNCYKEGFME